MTFFLKCHIKTATTYMIFCSFLCITTRKKQINDEKLLTKFYPLVKCHYQQILSTKNFAINFSTDLIRP